jgi:hypothetical protein
MPSMHLDGDKPAASSGQRELPDYTSPDVYDESISHVAERYRGTNSDQHGEMRLKRLHSDVLILR